MTKEQALGVIDRKYRQQDIQVLLLAKPARNRTQDQIVLVDIKQLDRAHVSDKAVWQLRFGKSERDVLSLYFSESHLIQLVRYRRAFVL